MLIMSSDRKKILDCDSIEVVKNFGAKKEEKFALVGSAGISSELSGKILALFPDEKSAIDTLEKIFTAFESGANSYKL